MINNISKSDEEVAREIIDGDNDKFEIIINRYEQKLLRYVIYLINNKSNANDAVQETFIKTYINLKSFNPKYKFSSWIYRIAHNEAMNIVKKNRNLSEQDIDEIPPLSYDAQIEKDIDKKILQEDVMLCLKKLDLKYREVIQLAYFENMKYEEISDILKIPVSTVGIRLSRARNNLKKICNQNGVSYEAKKK